MAIWKATVACSVVGLEICHLKNSHGQVSRTGKVQWNVLQLAQFAAQRNTVDTGGESAAVTGKEKGDAVRHENRSVRKFILSKYFKGQRWGQRQLLAPQN